MNLLGLYPCLYKLPQVARPQLVESRGGIILRPSLARSERAHFCALGSRCSRVSPCPCGCNRDSFHVPLEGFWFSSCYDCRPRGADVLVLH